MKQTIIILSLLFVGGFSIQIEAQNWLNKLGKKVVESAQNATERNVENKVNKTVDQTFDKSKDIIKKGNKESKQEGSENSESDSVVNSSDKSSQRSQRENSPEMTYAKSDFVAGDEIVFDDNQSNEQMGEFPSQWELIRGNAEISSINGKKAICMISEDSWIEPLMKNSKSYLGDRFTLEFDFWCEKRGIYDATAFELDFMTENAPKDDDLFTLTWLWNDMDGNAGGNDYEARFLYGWNGSNGRSSGESRLQVKSNDWNHISVSFNKRALKMYLNGIRFANVPNVAAYPGWVSFFSGHGAAGRNKYISNVRIARGAVPLYDRIMSEGKFISYGITFDIGKSTIKPESMGEINRIVKLMTDNPTLKFSVEGHTDNTGNATNNQTLSESRSKAIVDKLVEMGISADRLSSSGKGQNSPIADNSTENGRAKNRRVEFVKM